MTRFRPGFKVRRLGLAALLASLMLVAPFAFLVQLALGSANIDALLPWGIAGIVTLGTVALLRLWREVLTVLLLAMIMGTTLVFALLLPGLIKQPQPANLFLASIILILGGLSGYGIYRLGPGRSPLPVPDDPSALLAASDLVIDAEPQNPSAWYNKGIAHGGLGQFAEAVWAFNNALELQPQDPDALYNKGVSHLLLDEYEEALSSFDAALKLLPDREECWVNRGIALSNLGRFADAIASYDNALRLEPRDSGAWRNRGFDLGNVGRYEEALDAADAAVRLDPNDAWSMYDRCVSLTALRRYDEALQAIDKTLAMAPDVPQVWRGKSLVLARMGRVGEASQADLQAQKLENSAATGGQI